MKTLSLTVALWILSPLISSGALYEFSQQDLYVRCWLVDETFPWMAKGKLVYYQIDRERSQSAYAAFYENPELPAALSLGSAPEAVAEVVRREVPEVTERFLVEHFARFYAFATQRLGWRVVDSMLVADIAEQKGAEAVPDAEARFPRASIDQNEWRLSFWVRSPNGDLRHFELSGIVSPFGIQRQSFN